MSSLVQQNIIRAPQPGQRTPRLEQFFHGLITATSAGATQLLYTAPSDVGQAGSRDQVSLMTDVFIANIDAADHTLTLYMIESGGSVADGRLLFKNVLVPAETVYHIQDMQGLVGNGGTIRAYADATNVIVARIVGEVGR